MSRGIQAQPIILTDQELRVATAATKSRTLRSGQHQRIAIILSGAEGEPILRTARRLKVTPKTVAAWRNRFLGGLKQLRAFAQGPDGEGVSDKALLDQMMKLLSDQPRSGKPARISPAQIQQVVALACKKPSDYGHPRSGWTHDLIAQVAKEQGIVDKISGSYVGKLLKNTAPASAPKSLLALP